MPLKSSETTYKLTVDELCEMFAKELSVKTWQVSINENMATGGYGVGEHRYFAGLTVTVNHNAREPRVEDR